MQTINLSIQAIQETLIPIINQFQGGSQNDGPYFFTDAVENPNYDLAAAIYAAAKVTKSTLYLSIFEDLNQVTLEDPDTLDPEEQETYEPCLIIKTYYKTIQVYLCKC